MRVERHLQVRNGSGMIGRMAEPATHQVEYAPYGDFEADCPARFATELFANTWLPVVVYVLRDGPMRPGELRTAIGGVSQKVLTQTLRRMERLTLVTRRRYAEAPPRVEYELTPAGQDLLVPILALGAWADRHGAAVASAMDDAGSEDRPTGDRAVGDGPMSDVVSGISVNTPVSTHGSSRAAPVPAAGGRG